VSVDLPRILSKPIPDLLLVGGFNQMSSQITAADGSSDDNEAIGDQAVHELGVVVPAVLLADTACVIPCRAVPPTCRGRWPPIDRRRTVRHRLNPCAPSTEG
jgi:hypothetical protein